MLLGGCQHVENHLTTVWASRVTVWPCKSRHTDSLSVTGLCLLTCIARAGCGYPNPVNAPDFTPGVFTMCGQPGPFKFCFDCVSPGGFVYAGTTCSGRCPYPSYQLPRFNKSATALCQPSDGTWKVTDAPECAFTTLPNPEGEHTRAQPDPTVCWRVPGWPLLALHVTHCWQNFISCSDYDSIRLCDSCSASVTLHRACDGPVHTVQCTKQPQSLADWKVLFVTITLGADQELA